MDGATRNSAISIATKADPWRAQGQRPWKTLLAGDANGDRIRDIAWRNANVGGEVIWLLNARANAGAAFTGGWNFEPADGRWIVGACRDGRPQPRQHDGSQYGELPSNGQTIVWLMNGTQVSEAINFLTGGTSSWYIGAVTDVNRDERDDMIWYNSSGSGFIWYLDGTPAPSSYLITTATLPTLPTGYRMQGAGDFDRDGYPDFVLRNTTTGEGVIWLMDQNVFGEAVSLPTVSTVWQMGTIGD